MTTPNWIAVPLQIKAFHRAKPATAFAWLESLLLEAGWRLFFRPKRKFSWANPLLRSLVLAGESREGLVGTEFGASLFAHEFCHVRQWGPKRLVACWRFAQYFLRPSVRVAMEIEAHAHGSVVFALVAFSKVMPKSDLKTVAKADAEAVGLRMAGWRFRGSGLDVEALFTARVGSLLEEIV